MIIKDCKARDMKIAYIGGGSRAWAWGFMMDLAMDEQMEGEVCLYDIDREAAENNQVIGAMISAHPDAKAHWRYTVADSLKEVLTGADFVVISILPGTFDEMESDVHLPEKYGIYQSVGDTAGPGGLIRALRTLPMYAEIGRAIRDYSPEAWVITYTNPMTLCVRTLYEVFPQIKAFGCCHEVFHAQDLLADMLKMEYGYEGVGRKDIKINVIGINHFTWINKATWQDKDLMPMFAPFVDKYFETGFKHEGADDYRSNTFVCDHRVLFDLFRKYGAIGAANDRHLAEFMRPWYLKDPETVKSWHFALTPVSWRKEDLKAKRARSEGLRNGSIPLELKPSGEEGHLMIKALLGFGDLVTNVNLPNMGQIPNLPMGAVVETNAHFTRSGVAPVFAGPVPGNLLGLIMPHVVNQENILRAALTCDRQLAFTTFMNDPLVTVDEHDGRELFDQMVANTAKYLPEGWSE